MIKISDMNTLRFSIIVFLLVAILSCKKEVVNTDTTNAGKIVFKFEHKVDGQTLIQDSMIYINEAGNPYSVNEIQYFISDVILYKSGGTQKLIQDWQDKFYVDIDIPTTLTWVVYDTISAGLYDSISFTFGISEEKNHSYMFVNPPESFMFWPTILGGGYHYLKLNGKWQTPTQNINPFNFHLGIGQLYSGTDTTYVHNHFRVSLPGSSFTMVKGQTKEIGLLMNIENWFKNPHAYNHDIWGGDIMENQDAMLQVKENGHDVFSIEYIN